MQEKTEQNYIPTVRSIGKNYDGGLGREKIFDMENQIHGKEKSASTKRASIEYSLSEYSSGNECE